jgi:hypothetical protein
MTGHQTAFPVFFRLSSIIFVISVLFYIFFYSINGAQPNSTSFFVACYSLAGVSGAIGIGGILAFARQGFSFGWQETIKVVASVVTGFAMTFASAPYPPYGVFEMSYTGFPLPFTATSYTTLSSFTSVSPLAFAIDGVFWISLSFPAIWLLAAVIDRKLSLVSRFEAIGVAAFLTFGLYPGWEALFSTGLFNSMFAALGPGILPILFFIPSLVLGSLIAFRGIRSLGFTMVVASLLLVSFMSIAILEASQHVIL